MMAGNLQGAVGDSRHADAFLRDVLERIRNLAPKKLKDLRDECTTDLERLDTVVARGGAINADEFVRSFKLACEAVGNPKVVSTALEAVEKLMATGLLTGRGPDIFSTPAPDEEPPVLMDSVIQFICTCAEQTDDNVGHLMIKALATAVTSQHFEVHGNSLMLAVRTCFTINRDSKNATTQKTAHLSLTTMLGVVTQRMEMSSGEMRKNMIVEDGRDPRRQQHQFKPPSSELALLPPKEVLDDWVTSYLNAKLVDPIVRARGEAQGKFGCCIVCRAAAGHYCIETNDPVCCHACKFRNLERISVVETHFGARRDEEEQMLLDCASTEVDEDAAGTSASDFPRRRSVVNERAAGKEPAEVFDHSRNLNPHHKDALMVFQSLCKLSNKDLPAGPDSRHVRSKRLSLELVLSMLQNCGPVFKSSEEFIKVMKNSLCVSLIKNSVSSIPKIFSIALNIFTTLMSNFKDHLKSEIGVFIEQIFLRMLESGNSTHLQKQRVLKVFSELCTDASTALELFLNFDCDVDEKNIFERMIDCLSKISQGKYTAVEHANVISPGQEQELKMQALKALVTLMGSIVDWSRRMNEDQQRVCETTRSVVEQDSDAEDDARSETTIATTTISTTSGGGSIVEQKHRKHELQIGVNKFNMKAKRGIEYLRKNGFVTDDPKDIAEFLQKTDLGLDKTAIGDFIGEGKEFNKNILYALVDSLDFKGQDLDASLRNFLSIFRLPGEAQKVDRMMEKFAEKYWTDNPGTFVSADCAFVLSFSMIMLQTDLHNPGVKNRMTKDEYVHNNRGINDGQDLPREFLENIYEGVKGHPFSLQEDVDAKTKMESQNAQNTSQKFELFKRETETIVQKSEELMKQRVSRKQSHYVSAQNVEHVRPLFEVACWPMLATLAVLLEMQDSLGSVDACIEGFKHCIRIAARFDMDTERDAFVSSLAKFTYLTTLKEMKQKNIECIKALLTIGLSEGNNLGPSWFFVLHCISQLERLQLINIRARQDFQVFNEEEEMTRQSMQMGNQSLMGKRAYHYGTGVLMNIGSGEAVVDRLNSESVMAQIDAAQIDLLFNKSTALSSGAIVHFVTQLARVSKEELALPEQSRIFCLQKLVEVADYNMNRIRLDWSRVWRVLSQHFVEAASHPNIRVSMYAVDSLRQLAKKFLEKDELSNYNFQAEFLKPFETVISTPGVSSEVKDHIVQIMSTLVQGQMKNIRSGWKTVFHVLHAAAQEQGAKDNKVAKSAFEIMERVLKEHHSLFVDNFGDGVRVLLAFGHCQADVAMSQKAITFLLQAAAYLADPTKELPPPPPQYMKDREFPAGADTQCHTAAHWLPILRGLSMLVSDSRRDVRAAALNGVFDCLREYGSGVFDKDTWRMVFNGVIKPLFDDIHHQLGDQRKENVDTSRDGTAASWAAAMGPPTCLAALTALVRLFDAELDSLSFLLDEVLKLLESCIQHDTEAVARIGVEGFKQLLILTGKNLSEESWQKVTLSILQLFDNNMPKKLLKVDENANDGWLPFRKDEVVIQCVVQLLLIDMLQECVTQHYDNIPPVGIMTLLDALQRSFEFAQKFNQQIQLRQVLKRLGFMREMRQLPGLLKQEREALSCSLKILFQVQGDSRMQESEYASPAIDRLMHICCTVLRKYVEKERALQEQGDGAPVEPDREAAIVETEREVMGLVPIIIDVVLRGLGNLPSEQFNSHVGDLYPLLVDLVSVNHREVRIAVQEILMEQIRPLIIGATAPSKRSEVETKELS